MIIGWPEGLLLGMLAVGLIVYAFVDGKPQTGTYSFPIKLIDTSIFLGLLYWGGFFS